MTSPWLTLPPAPIIPPAPTRSGEMEEACRRRRPGHLKSLIEHLPHDHNRQALLRNALIEGVGQAWAEGVRMLMHELTPADFDGGDIEQIQTRLLNNDSVEVLHALLDEGFELKWASDNMAHRSYGWAEAPRMVDWLLSEPDRLPVTCQHDWMHVVVRSPQAWLHRWPASWRGDPSDPHAWALASQPSPYTKHTPAERWWEELLGQDVPIQVEASLRMGWGPPPRETSDLHRHGAIWSALLMNSHHVAAWLLQHPDLRAEFVEAGHASPAATIEVALIKVPFNLRPMWFPVLGWQPTPETAQAVIASYNAYDSRYRSQHEEVVWWQDHFPEVLYEATSQIDVERLREDVAAEMERWRTAHELRQATQPAGPQAPRRSSPRL